MDDLCGSLATKQTAQHAAEKRAHVPAAESKLRSTPACTARAHLTSSDCAEGRERAYVSDPTGVNYCKRMAFSGRSNVHSKRLAPSYVDALVAIRSLLGAMWQTVARYRLISRC
jgi:hypothetical protein